MTKGTAPKPSLKKATPGPQKSGQEQSVGPLTQLLIRARQRIVDPRRWSRGAYGRKADASACNVKDPDCVAWCAAGALEYEAERSTPSWEPPPPGGKAPKKEPDRLYHAAHALLEQAGAEVVRTVTTNATEE